MGGSSFVLLVGSSGLDMMCHILRLSIAGFLFFLAPKLPNHDIICHNPAININQKTYILDNFKRL